MTNRLVSVRQFGNIIKLSKPVWRLPVHLKMSTFETLTFDNLALSSLPIDGVTANYPRNVSGACFSMVELSPLEKPVLVAWSSKVAELLDLSPGELSRPEAPEYLSGSKLIPSTEPAAHCYCGHQFGYFAGQLGDGAAKYLGEVINSKNERWEIQLKGSGPTPYSRTADGRKVLRSSIREFLCSEAMHHLGIPTTRALSCVTSDDVVVRDLFYDGNPINEKCTVVCRVSPSFIRFGSFEIFKTLDPMTDRVGPSVGRDDLLKKMLQYVISTFYSQIFESYKDDEETMYAEFYKEIVIRTARLVAQWQCVGFCHGVLNTDNMSILGVTIDYGPFGFMESFSPNYICNASDDGGRYSYINQPKMCEWNLKIFAEALQRVLPTDISKNILATHFADTYNEHYLTLMRKKLGFVHKCLPEDKELVADFLNTLEATGADFTNSFRVLSEISMPGMCNFEHSVEQVKIKLVGYSCSALELKDMHRPTMADSHFKLYIQLLSQHPEVLAQLGKGSEVIRREIERREKFETLKDETDDGKKSRDEQSWIEWLNKYVNRLKLETESVDVNEANLKKITIMNATNPKFILRNYIAQTAIEAAENNDFTEVNKLLQLLEKPFDDDTLYEQQNVTKTRALRIT